MHKAETACRTDGSLASGRYCDAESVSDVKHALFDLVSDWNHFIKEKPLAGVPSTPTRLRSIFVN